MASALPSKGMKAAAIIGRGDLESRLAEAAGKTGNPLHDCGPKSRFNMTRGYKG